MGVGLLLPGMWALVRGQWIGGLWYTCLGFFLRDAAISGYQDALIQDAIIRR